MEMSSRPSCSCCACLWSLERKGCESAPLRKSFRLESRDRLEEFGINDRSNGLMKGLGWFGLRKWVALTADRCGNGVAQDVEREDVWDKQWDLSYSNELYVVYIVAFVWKCTFFDIWEKKYILRERQVEKQKDLHSLNNAKMKLLIVFYSFRYHFRLLDWSFHRFRDRLV